MDLNISIKMRSDSEFADEETIDLLKQSFFHVLKNWIEFPEGAVVDIPVFEIQIADTEETADLDEIALLAREEAFQEKHNALDARIPVLTGMQLRLISALAPFPHLLEMVSDYFNEASSILNDTVRLHNQELEAYYGDLREALSLAEYSLDAADNLNATISLPNRQN